MTEYAHSSSINTFGLVDAKLHGDAEGFRNVPPNCSSFVVSLQLVVFFGVSKSIQQFSIHHLLQRIKKRSRPNSDPSPTQKRRRRIMSWLASSIADGLRLDGDDQEDTEAAEVSNRPNSALRSQTPNYRVPLDDRQLDGTPDSLDRRLSNDEDDTSDDHGEGRGVTEDLSEIRDSFARQLRGVASFLAPQPPPDASKSQFIRRSDSFHSESKYGRAGSDDDVEEHNDELFEYDARDSDQFPELTSVSLSEDYYTRIVQEAVGITEEALAFARNIAHHPETWLDFPIEEEEFDGA